MNIQTISIVVPTKGCVNKCKFCVSRMHENNYEIDFNKTQMKKRIKWAVMNGINTCILTGTGEALQNRGFLEKLADLFKEMDYPFPNVELQTSGVLLMKEDGYQGKGYIDGRTGKQILIYGNIELLKWLGVNTISLSVSNIFDDESNMSIIGTSERLQFKLKELIFFLKINGFNVRLSLNMTSVYNLEHSGDVSENILNKCKDLGADQITFRKLYAGNDDSEQTKWVKEHSADERILKAINDYIVGYKKFNGFGDIIDDSEGKGTPLYDLPFGATVYSIKGMSVVIDTNCMNKESMKSLKYVILRENGKLYSQWDDEGSLIF
jgi:hypothetical protein